MLSKEHKETDIRGLMMRFGDGGDPVSISFPTGKEHWEVDTRAGFRESTGKNQTINVFFKEEIPVGSVLNFGEGDMFEVVRPSRSAENSGFPPSVYAQRINEERFNQIKDEGDRQIYDSIDKMPLSDRTKEEFESD